MEGVTEVKRVPKPGYIVMLVVNLLALIALIVLSVVNITIFSEGPDYDLDIVPADWTFLIWAVIYADLIAIALYALTLACRYNSITCGQLYYDPPFLPPTFFAILVISHVFNITWFYAIDSEYVVAAFVALFALWMCLHICIILSVRLLWKYECELSRTEMWINVILVQNGLGIYVTWAAIATVLNFGFVLFYQEDVSMETTCWVGLSIIGALYVIHAIFDVIMGFYSRYQFAPYLVYIWALAGIVERNYDPDADFQILAIALLGLSILGLLIKLILTIVGASRNPTALETDE